MVKTKQRFRKYTKKNKTYKQKYITHLHISNADKVGNNDRNCNVTMSIKHAQRCKMIGGNDERLVNNIIIEYSNPDNIDRKDEIFKYLLLERDVKDLAKIIVKNDADTNLKLELLYKLLNAKLTQSETDFIQKRYNNLEHEIERENERETESKNKSRRSLLQTKQKKDAATKRKLLLSEQEKTETELRELIEYKKQERLHRLVVKPLEHLELTKSEVITPLHISNADKVGGNECKGNVTTRITNAQRCKYDELAEPGLLDTLVLSPAELGIEYNNDEIPKFWEKMIFKNILVSDQSITTEMCRTYIQEIINNYILCNNITLTTSNELHHNYICNSLLFIAYVTLLLDGECTIIIKGGKAVQLANKLSGCNIAKYQQYVSPDVDIIIVKNPNSKYSTQLLAKEIGKLFLWVMNYTKPIISLLEITLPEPIIKISHILPSGGYYALIDIGYNELNENIKSYFQGNYIQQIIFPNGKLYIPTVPALVNERLYYLIKYFNDDYDELEKINIDRFITKIYKSLNALLICVINNLEVNKRNDAQKSILLHTYLLNIINEKFKHIPVLNRFKLIDTISLAVLTRNIDITQYYSPTYE